MQSFPQYLALRLELISNLRQKEAWQIQEEKDFLAVTKGG